MTARTEPLTRGDLAAMIDHTLLRPEATREEVRRLCAEARELHVKAVCVSPNRVALAAAEVRGTGVLVAAVVGFPSGAHRSDVKAAEAAAAVRDGADELDMVIDLGLARERRWDDVQADIAAVRAAAPEATLKVIIEAALLDPEGLAAACRAAEAGGAEFVKTSTGFHSAGGASVDAVRVMAETVRGRLGVKASGGIRTAEAALAMVGAGATRLGLSGTAAVLDALPG